MKLPFEEKIKKVRILINVMTFTSTTSFKGRQQRRLNCNLSTNEKYLPVQKVSAPNARFASPDRNQVDWLGKLLLIRLSLINLEFILQMKRKRDSTLFHYFCKMISSLKMSSSSQRKRDLKIQATIASLQKYYSKKYEPDYQCPMRTVYLSNAKQNKLAWEATFEPTLFWGTQQMIHPISKAALKAEASDRLKELARPKKNFRAVVDRPIFLFSIGRPSVIWEVSAAALKSKMNERLQRLAQPKRSASENLDPKHHFRYNMGRPSVIWKVSESAKRYVCSAKIAALAKPKNYDTFESNKATSEMCLVSSNAMQYSATEITEGLAKPKERLDGPVLELGYPEEPIWKISPGALGYEASENIAKLAEPKFPHPDFLPNREIPWVISDAAKRGPQSPRYEVLAKPQRRATMDHVQFDPEAFFVKPNALKAACSPRTEQLSMPITRI